MNTEFMQAKKEYLRILLLMHWKKHWPKVMKKIIMTIKM